MNKWLVVGGYFLSAILAGASFSKAQDAVAAPTASPNAAAKSNVSDDTPNTRLINRYIEFLNKLLRKEYADATADFESLVRTYWNDSFRKYAGQQLYRRISQTQLIEGLTALRDANPQDPVPHRMLGYVAVLQGDSVKAIQHLNKAIELDPNHAVTFFMRGQPDAPLSQPNMFALFGRADRTEDDKRGLQDITEAIRLDGKVAQFYLYRGKIKTAIDIPQDALEDADAAVGLEQNVFESMMLRGDVFLRTENYSSAAEDFTTAIAAWQNPDTSKDRIHPVDYCEMITIDPPLCESYAQRAEAKGNMKDYHGAIEDINEALKICKFAKNDLYNSRAEMYIGLKDYKSALADLEKDSSNLIFRKVPERRAWVKLRLKDYQGALKDYNEVIGDSTWRWEALTGRGIAKHHLGDNDGALADFDEAIKWMGKWEAEPYVARGMLYADLRDPQRALAEFQRAIEVDARHVGAHFQHGLANHTIKNYLGAMRDFDEVIRLEPDNVGAYFNLGLAQRAAGKFSNAIASFDKAIQREPTHLRSHYFRGIANHESGNNAAAIADYDQTIAINSKYASAYLQRAAARIELSDFKAALADIDTAIELENQSVQAIARKAFLLATWEDSALRDAKLAGELANRALEIDPTDPQAMSARACADAASNNFASAITWEIKATKNNRFVADKGIDGGTHAPARISAWQANKLWTIPIVAKK